MYTKTEIIDYVENVLPSLLIGSMWKSLDQADYAERLIGDFSIYVRIRPLASIPNGCMSDFTKYASLRAIRGSDEKIVFACDSEWQEYVENGERYRFIISWQFAFIRDDELFEVIFLAKNTNHRLDLLSAIAVLYSMYNPNYSNISIDARKVVNYSGYVEQANGKRAYMTFETKAEAKKMTSNVETWYSMEKIDTESICLLFHAGLVDITAFDRSSIDYMLKRCSNIQKGIVSLKSMKKYAELQHNKYKVHKRLLPFSFSIRDTMCQAPAGHRSLKELGASIGYNKISLEDGYITRMAELLVIDPLLYFEYAATDAVVTLLYAANLYGENIIPHVTLTSASAGVMKDTIADYLDVDDSDEFDKTYRGLHTVKKGKVATKRSVIPYIQATDLEPINIDAHHVQYMASLAYHGGYNICNEVGYYTNQTYDFDLKNAYPTGMCLVPDVCWESPIKHTYRDVEISEVADELFSENGPMSFLLVNITSFKFPQNTAYPCIPVVVEGIPIYPLEYNVDDPACSKVPMICVTGPELYLAYKLGASIHIKEGYVLNPRHNDDNTISKSLADSVKQLVIDRTQAKTYAKQNNISNYLCDTILKVMVNSGYGKVAQNTISKKTWSAFSDEMEEVGPSSITNPVSAAFITAIIRCTLLAAQNECTDLGYKIYSVTTDGFISDIPEVKLKNLPLYGFRKLLHSSRMFLTNNTNGEIWEIKHQQTDLLNFTTRGNVSCSTSGVCAHNGAVSGYTKDSVEDRTWLTEQVLSRTSKISFDVDIWTTFKEIVLHKKEDFLVVHGSRNISMDYDMKRKPLKDSFYTVKPLVAGKEYEIACFATVPYNDVGEYQSYRSLMKWITEERKIYSSKALRTEYDWLYLFWAKLVIKNKITQKKQYKKNVDVDIPKPIVKDVNKKSIAKAPIETDPKIVKKIRNCFYAFNAGVLDIPLLSNGTVAEFLNVLNHSNITNYIFSASQFKNYAKECRFPAPLKSGNADIIKHFLDDQEPILSLLVGLSSPTTNHPQNK